MLIEGILAVIYNVFSVLTMPINIPSMPANVEAVMGEFLQWLQVGLQIVATFTHEGYLLVLFGIVVAVDVGVMLYKFVMWVLKKIPLLGIE